jgi:hypothetical protein
LSTSDVQILEEMLQSSPELLQRVDAIRRFDEEHIAQRKSPSYLLEDARQRSRRSEATHEAQESGITLGQRLNSLLSSGWGWAAIGAVMIAILLPMIDKRLPSKQSEQNRARTLRELYSQNSYHGRTRAKGGGTIWEVYRAPDPSRPNTRSVLLKEDAVIHPGQRIGFRLYPKQKGYYMIIGRDSSQKWYLGAPILNPEIRLEEQPAQEVSGLFKGTTSIDLTEALEFDDLLGREELFLFFCEESTSYGSLHSALIAQQTSLKRSNQNVTQIKLPGRCKLSFISLDKRAR